jgi:Carboxypeptidase regulatory-like domain
MKPLLILVSLATLLSACNGSRLLSNPTAPDSPRPTVAVSGVVSAMTPAGVVPVAGVRVDVQGDLGRFATTDANGFYSMQVVSGAPTLLSASKFGYDTHRQNVTVSEDTRLDIRLTQVTTFTISGVVFELTAAGRAPLDNVDLYCDSCGEIGVGHTFTRTDTNGYYTFVGVFAGSNPIQVSKAGYQDPAGVLIGSGSPQWYMRQVSVVGNTRLDIELVRR